MFFRVGSRFVLASLLVTAALAVDTDNGHFTMFRGSNPWGKSQVRFYHAAGPDRATTYIYRIVPNVGEKLVVNMDNRLGGQCVITTPHHYAQDEDAFPPKLDLGDIIPVGCAPSGGRDKPIDFRFDNIRNTALLALLRGVLDVFHGNSVPRRARTTMTLNMENLQSVRNGFSAFNSFTHSPFGLEVIRGITLAVGDDEADVDGIRALTISLSADGSASLVIRAGGLGQGAPGSPRGRKTEVGGGSTSRPAPHDDGMLDRFYGTPAPPPVHNTGYDMDFNARLGDRRTERNSRRPGPGTS